MTMARSLSNGLKEVRRILSESSELIRLELIEVESERLTQAALREMTGRHFSRIDFYSNINSTELNEKTWNDLIDNAKKRKSGYPLQYLIGYETFLNHEYEVGPGVLIPRPETEGLVMAIISVLEPQGEPQLGLEIGLGSGIISIELLSHFQSLRMNSSELSPAAKKYAVKNANRILKGDPHRSRLNIIESQASGDVFEPFSITEKADFIVSNPPYLIYSPQTMQEVEVQVIQFEPQEALLAPVSDPCYFYRKIAENANRYLKPKGWVFVEMPHERSKEILETFQFHQWNCRIEKDLNQRDRILIAQLGERANG
jgi:release factor glutamine methyltransferase